MPGARPPRGQGQAGPGHWPRPGGTAPPTDEANASGQHKEAVQVANVHHLEGWGSRTVKTRKNMPIRQPMSNASSGAAAAGRPGEAASAATRYAGHLRMLMVRRMLAPSGGSMVQCHRQKEPASYTASASQLSCKTCCLRNCLTIRQKSSKNKLKNRPFRSPMSTAGRARPAEQRGAASGSRRPARQPRSTP